MARTVNAPPALRLYKGVTTHERLAPVSHKFRYRLFLLDLDIDHLEDANLQSKLFSVDRPNLFYFKTKDHGNRSDRDLRPWAENTFADADVSLDGGPIRLVTMARHLFYKFAPISLWFGYNKSGDLQGVIYEVNNTFGQSHCYVAKANGARSQHDADKQLYVSPFFDVSGKYRFTLREPNDRLSLVIENIVENKRVHVATIKGQLAQANGPAFLKAMFARPFSSFAVTAAIHFEALRLWFKGAGYRSNPGAPKTPTTSAQTISPASQAIDSGQKLSSPQ